MADSKPRNAQSVKAAVAVMAPNELPPAEVERRKVLGSLIEETQCPDGEKG